MTHPSGGGQSSDFSIMSIAHEDGENVIIGMDASSSFHHNEVMEMLEQHVLRIRNDQRYEDALIVIFIEANMSFLTSSYLGEYFKNKRFGPTYCPSFDPANKNVNLFRNSFIV